MESSIPFQEGFVLGRSLDVTKDPFKTGPFLIPDDINSTDFRVNIASAQFAVIDSITDVCDILQLPLAYVLKVEANLVQNHVIASCLTDVGKKNNISVIFRLSFLQQKKYLPSDTQLNRDALHSVQDGGQPQESSRSVTKKALQQALDEDQPEDNSVSATKDALQQATDEDQPQDNVTSVTKDGLHSIQDGGQRQDNSGSVTRTSESNGSPFSATHWVKALEVGNELIVICRISSPEREHISSTFKKLTESLGNFRGSLEAAQIHGLEEFAKSMDKKLKKSHYKDMHTSIEYGAFSELQFYPANFTDMVNVMKEFVLKCEAWKDVYRQTTPNIFNKGPMIWNKGSYHPKEIGMIEGFLRKQDTPIFFRDSYISSETDSGDGDSIQIIAAESDYVYHLRAILQPLEDDDMSHSFDRIEFPESYQSKFQCLHKVFINSIKEIEKLQNFLASDYFISENFMMEGKALMKTFQERHANMIDAIGRLDLISVPNEEELRFYLNSDMPKITDDFIENVTSKLPPGPDLDLLLIGKTGHGKSSSGNSILRQNKFEASASGDSVTQTCGVGWSRIDGRIIKVVDTPGVCDTRYDSESSDIDNAIRAISDAIVHCPEGFHALLLVIRFGQRMTTDEKKAIGMLKCILGEDIIKDHCICVITHGDNFRSEIKGEKTFFDWCRSQSGFLNDILKECQYRCVLFDNKNEDPKCLNRQLIELISIVDGLSSKGTRYTNSIFEYALKARKRLIEEEKAPEVDENVTRDIQLILSHLEKMVEGSDEIKSFESDLENLRCTVDNLKNQVNGMEGGKMDLLVDTVFRLSQVIHSKMDEIANRPELPEEAKRPEDAISKNLPAAEAQIPSHESFSAEIKNTQKNLEAAQKEIDSKSKDINDKVTEDVKVEVKEKSNCFPGVSWVITKDGSHRSMSDLEVGDEILVRNRKGKFVFEKVYMFGHRDIKAVEQFLVLETKHQRVTVSRDHIVYCIKNGLEASPPARFIREGDELITFSCNGLEKQPVLRISLEKQRGLYAPFTKSGSLIVDGALMSCYVDVVPPATAHKLLSPLRILYQISPSALNFVNGYNRGEVIPTWAKLILKLK